VCGHTHDWGGWHPTFGVFLTENDYHLHSHLGTHTEILNASFVFLLVSNS